MCKVLTVANQKGGVAKTTTVLNLATALSIMGKKVLAVDADPQGSLTICAGVQSPDSLIHTTYSLLNAVLNEDKLPEPSEYIISCEKIDVIPCNISLSAIELNRGHEIGCESALQSVITPLKELYDYVIIDTTPSLGILTVNAITASDGVLITVTPQLLSAIGLKLLIKTGLSDDEAKLIVTETNLVQRSFADLSHSERAIALSSLRTRFVHQSAFFMPLNFFSLVVSGVVQRSPGFVLGVLIGRDGR